MQTENLNEFVSQAYDLCKTALLKGVFVKMRFTVGEWPKDFTVTFQPATFKDYEKYKRVVQVDQIFRKQKTYGIVAFGGKCCSIYEGETTEQMLEKIVDMIEYNKSQGLK